MNTKSPGSRIKILRQQLGISQEELGRRLGVSVVTINRWEREVNQPSPLALREIGRLEILNTPARS